MSWRDLQNKHSANWFTSLDKLRKVRLSLPGVCVLN